MDKCQHKYEEIGIYTHKFKCKKCGKTAETMKIDELLERTKNLPSTKKIK